MFAILQMQQHKIRKESLLLVKHVYDSMMLLRWCSNGLGWIYDSNTTIEKSQKQTRTRLMQTN